MAITATFASQSRYLENAYLRVTRVWGSKDEGWHAWVAVLANSDDKEPLELFGVSAPYADGQNPFEALYNSVLDMSFVKNGKSDVIKPTVVTEVVADPVVEVKIEEPVIEAESEVIHVEKPKKPRGRSKKN